MAHVPSRIRKKVEWLMRRAEGALLPDRVLGEEGRHLDPRSALFKLAEPKDDVAELGVGPRVRQLNELAVRGTERAAARRVYVEQHGIAGVQRFHSQRGTRTDSMSVETFPRHINNVYLLIDAGSVILFDCGCGSGLDSPRRELALDFAMVRDGAPLERD
jgi:hypothetical protein